MSFFQNVLQLVFIVSLRAIYRKAFEFLQCVLNITFLYNLKRIPIDFEVTGSKIKVISSYIAHKNFQMLR